MNKNKCKNPNCVDGKISILVKEMKFPCPDCTKPEKPTEAIDLGAEMADCFDKMLDTCNICGDLKEKTDLHRNCGK